jgi:glycogen debranching enzyme
MYELSILSSIGSNIMRRRSVLGGLAVGAATGEVGTGYAATPKRRAATTPVLNSLAIPVTVAQNRQYSYTDKVSGYFHGRTHMDANPDWFNGWNIATKRIFHDYRLSVDGVALSRADAQASVSPHKLVRTYAKAAETLSMLDGLAVLVVQLSGVSGAQIGLALTGDLTDAGTLSPQGIWFAPKEAAGTVLLLAPIANVALQFDAARRATGPATMGGFFLIHAATKELATALLARVRRGLPALLAARAGRMEALVSGNHALDAGDPDRTKALLWMRLTGDQLVTKQLGTGIYAGLPWFNDYWGRDTFISITGLLFINGQYEEAARVFESFAALQDVDPKSKTYGRVPNRARPDGIEYNSADGTPRFIITLADLVNRSGDVALAKRLWPAVKRAVEGVLANNVDEHGLITHDDADTWMDAKEKGVRAWSPRGNRAIDVQALWKRAFDALEGLGKWADVGQGHWPLQELLRDDGLPDMVFTGHEAKFLEKVHKANQKLELAIPLHFVDAATRNVADHLRPDGTKNMQVRPNLFAAVFGIRTDKVPNAPASEGQGISHMRWVRELWEQLVYPWGVATLSQADPNFYPYHEHWHYYHKDAAYHNGTVWPWLNGDAISCMVTFGQIDLAWRLFENMNRQALREGAVGSLAECADALPIEGAVWTRRTGTFLQAWSNAEQLRVWKESFLGVCVSSTSGSFLVRPKLPDHIHNVSETVFFGKGMMKGVWHKNGPNHWSFHFLNARGRFVFYHPDFKREGVSADVNSGHSIEISRVGDKLRIAQFNAKHHLIYEDVQMSMAAIEPTSLDYWQVVQWKQDREARDEVFKDLDFCKPRLNPGLKSLSVRHDPPLTY